MTIIRPNSIAGITSITSYSGNIEFYKSDGTLSGLNLGGVNFNTTSGISTFYSINLNGGDITLGTGTTISSPSSNTFTVSTNGSERVRVDSSGNVNVDSGGVYYDATNNRLAIGTTTPDTIFSVQNVRSDTPGSGWFTYTASATAGKRGLRINTNNGFCFDYYNGSSWSQQAVIDSQGQLAIGTTSPNEAVTIATSSLASYIQICDSSTGTTSGDGLFIGSFNGAAEIKTKENNVLQFGTNNTERMRITNNGIVQINTSSSGEASYYLNVKATQAAQFGDNYDSSGYGCVQITRPSDQPDSKFHLSFIRAGQKIAGMGFLDNSNTFAIQNGNDNTSAGVTLTNAATSWGTTSDERVKNIVGEIDSGLDLIADWRTVYFNYINDTEEDVKRIGLIAQDVQATVPEAVSVEEDDIGTLQLRYTELIPVLVKALQESKDRIETLEAKIADLEMK